MRDLERLLEALDRPGWVSLCDDTSGRFRAHVVEVSQCVGRATEFARGNVWIGVGRLREGVTIGRGTARDVRALAALPIDLDVKPGGMPTWDEAHAVEEALAGILEADPVAVVNTGHGLQPWWALDPTDDRWQCDGAEDPRWLDMVAVVRRWGRLVAHVAGRHGGNVDTVFDLSRVMRAPGTMNVKDPTNPLPVTVERWGTGTPVTFSQLADALDAYGIPEVPGDRQTVGEVILAASTWAHGPRTCAYAARMIEGWASDTPASSGRHPWLVGQATRLAAAHRYGCLTSTAHRQAVIALNRRFEEIVSDPSLGQPRPVALGELSDALTWGIARVETMNEDTVRAELGGHEHPGSLTVWTPEVDGEPADRLAALIRHQRTYLDLPDPGHVLATLAVAATSELDGDPVWLLVVAPPSSGKTEAVRVLDDIANARLDDVTVAGLLSWSAGKNPTRQGVLTRIGERGLITFGDLSSLLATSDRGGRDAVFGMLRRVYDGHASRDVAAPGGRTAGSLAWTGRATIIGAVTGAIDNYSAHADKLGPRWLYVRLTGRDTHSRRRAARAARRTGLDTLRAQSRQLAAILIIQAREMAATVHIPKVIEDAVEDAALVTCWGRASVPRSGYGRKDPEGAPEVEDPPRLIRQALMLARGCLALGLDPEATATLARRCVLDSMPATRRAVLDALVAAEGELLATAAVGKSAGLHRHVARIALEDLEVVGAVTGYRIGVDGDEDDEEREDRRRREWTLAPTPDGQLVSSVLTAHYNDMNRWHELWGPPTPPPREGVNGDLESGNPAHISCHVQQERQSP